MGAKDRLDLEGETARMVGALVERARVAQREIDGWTQQQADEAVTAARNIASRSAGTPGGAMSGRATFFCVR